jgi:hypothetical protein
MRQVSMSLSIGVADRSLEVYALDLVRVSLLRPLRPLCAGICEVKGTRWVKGGGMCLRIERE